MLERGFVDFFNKQKEAFLKEYKKNSYEKILNSFEHWLRVEQGKAEEEFASGESLKFEDFVERVLARTREILLARGVKMIYPSAEQWLGLKSSWRCLKVLESKHIYYRVGRTRPRKGPYQNQDLLVFDLVMDGQKNQVFLPLLKQKRKIESELGEMLVRELPKVEATGKYRLKLVMPFQLVEHRNIGFASQKLADFILATKKALNGLGVN
ncbi:MAG: hypothetical protein AB1523_11360 [Bacillota bacterium]